MCHRLQANKEMNSQRIIHIGRRRRRVRIEAGHVVRPVVVGLALQHRQQAAVADRSQRTRQPDRVREHRH